MKPRKVLAMLGLAIFSIAIIAPAPSKAGRLYDLCITQPMGRFSSFDNMSLFCKCFQYAITKNLSPYMLKALINNWGEATEEHTKAMFAVRQKCGSYVR